MLIALALFAAAPRPATPACASNGPEAPGALHRRWIEQGWGHHPGDPPFDFRAKLGLSYDWSAPDGMCFGDFDPRRRAVRPVAAHAGVWGPIFRANRSARHVVSDQPSVLSGTPTLAASVMGSAARIGPMQGAAVGVATRSDLVRRCTVGRWRIVRAHNSSKPIRATEAEAALRGAGRS